VTYKIRLDDLKKAVQWVEANSRDVMVRIEQHYDGRNIVIKCVDKYEATVEIKLFNDGAMNVKIIKEEDLK
jgi:hypothetical protein